MDTFLLVFSAILIVTGLLGSVLPLLPGIPVSYLGLLLLHFTQKYSFSTQFLVLWALIVIIVQLLDNVLPIIAAKKYGGSKKGIWGSSIGTIPGMFFGIGGVLLGPFIGALSGELIEGKSPKPALKAAMGTFVGLIVSTLIKVVVALMFVYYYIVTVF